MRIAANLPRPALRLAALVLLAAAPSALAAPSVRLASRWDRKELTRDFPQAVETFERADAAAASGRLPEALALFDQASRLAPTSPAPTRRLCELYTDLGRRPDALRSCRQTIKYGDAPEDYRAMVGALMMPAQSPPTSEEFVNALIIASGVENRTPDDPMGHAAMFDIAHRLNDHRLMRAQLAALERVAAAHYETGRARRIVAALGPGPLVLLGWALLAALAAATAVRATARLRARARVVVKTALILLAMTALGGHAQAQAPKGQLSTFPVDDADPEASLPDRAEFRKDPLQFGYLVMDLADKADAAVKARDYQGAIRFYRALTRIAPDRSIGFGKMCEVYELAGDRQNALDSCRRALVTDGVRAEDYDRFVRLTLSGPGPVTAAEKTELGNVVANLRKAPDAAAAAAEIECRVAVRLGDAPALQRCTAELARLVPDSSNNIGYDWALATLNKDGAAAERALVRARQAGVNLAGLERMELVTRRAALTRSISYAVAVALVLAAVGIFLRRRREVTGPFVRRSVS
jgi:tetratricopeptide (TPR) repeat protein